ncbi:hypothetical protein L7F22_031508 [Adiantum nelumboides]|nr:hypothetical protein [Adiantum nelumboides]
MSAVLALPQVKDFLKTLAKGKEKGQEQGKEHDVNAHAVTEEGESSKKPWDEDVPELSSPSYFPPTSFSYSPDSSSSSNPRRRSAFLGFPSATLGIPSPILGFAGELEEDWQQLLEFANSLLHGYAQSHGVVPKGLEEDDVLHAPIDTKDALRAFTRFTNIASILFVKGRLPPAFLLRRWLNAIIKEDIVEEIFQGPHEFHEVLFKSMQGHNAVLESVPLFYEGQLVHTVEWHPLAEFQDILKREWSIWVECMQPNADMHVHLSNGDNNMSQQTCNGSDVNMDVPGDSSQVPILAMHDDKGKYHMPREEGQWQQVASRKGRTSEPKDAEHVGSQALMANPPRTYARRFAHHQPQKRGSHSSHYNLRSCSGHPIQPSSTLHFNKRGKVVTPWDGRYKELASTSWDKASTSSAPSSWHNSFAVLSDYMADLMAPLAAKDKVGPHSAC